MIVTVTPNPSIDRTLLIDELRRGHLVRATSSTVDPGGKGVNVSIALTKNGKRTTAVLPEGGDEGDQLVGLLNRQGLDLVAVPIARPIRSNITLVEPNGLITKINEPGPSLSADEVSSLLDATIGRAAGSEWVVGCGSLPPSVRQDFYATLVGAVPTRTAVDTTGPTLLEAVDAGVDLIKPNLFELMEATGQQAHTLGEVVEIAQTLRVRGAAQVLVSLGPDGAVLVGPTVEHGEAAVERVISSVGAGDALLSGFLANGSTGRDALAEGLAWAAASCELANTQMPSRDAIARQRVAIHDRVDPTRRIRPMDTP